MEPEEFVKRELEKVRINQLVVGDIFSYGVGNYRHIFIREVTRKDKGLGWEIISHNGLGRKNYLDSIHDTEDFVIRVKRSTDYDPKQQPYTDDDI